MAVHSSKYVQPQWGWEVRAEEDTEIKIMAKLKASLHISFLQLLHSKHKMMNHLITSI